MKETIKNKLTPEVALDLLKSGNKRFVNGVSSVEPLLSRLKLEQLAENGQQPFAIVLTCSDSRSPAEMIFDQGLGDLFVVRVAGNIVAPSLLASIEFAASNFGSSTVLVLGHSLCGAVTATIEHTKNPSIPLPSPNLEELVSRIRPAVEWTMREKTLNDQTLLDRSTENNVRRSVKLIQEQSAIIRDLVSRGKISVEGAVLNISTGIVSFLTQEE